MIQIKNRKFIMSQDERFIGMTGENNVEKREFVIDRNYKGTDLAELACFMEIIPINIDKPPYINIVQTTVAQHQIHIVWDVQAHDLVNSGKLYFDLKWVSPENLPVDGGTVEDEYIVFQTHRDYFRIGEDAINASAYSQDLPPDALEQAIAKTTQQANLAGEQARIAVENASKTQAAVETVAKAKQEINKAAETALEAVVEGVQKIESATTQVAEQAQEAKKMLTEANINSAQVRSDKEKVEAAAKQVATDKAEVQTMHQATVQNANKAEESADQTKINAEIAEEATTKMPYISTDGYWMVWNSKTRFFVNSGVKATGKQGEQGIQGIQGVQGIQGLRGLQGERGIAGPRGLKGDKGDKGEAGRDAVSQTIDRQVGFEVVDGQLFVVANDERTARSYFIDENGCLIMRVLEDDDTSYEEAMDVVEQAARDVVEETREILEAYIAESEAAKAGALEAQEEAETAATSAQASATAANQYAQSVNPDEIRTMVNAKGDGLLYDEATHMLYLTSGGEIISDGIQVATGTGGGGGGGESNNAVLTLKNTTGWMYKSVSLGASCPITFNWSSLEDDMPTGNGVLKISVNGTVKETRQIEQGDNSIDVGELLATGTCTVKVNVTDTYGNSRSINFNITAVSLELSSTFDATVAYEGDITFPYTPTAAVTKTMHFAVDGNEIGTATVVASGRQQTFVIPAQTHGMHIFECWYTATVDGEPVESDKLRYALICIEAGNTKPIIATAWNKPKVEQFDTLNIPYIVYDPASLTSKVYLSDGGTPTELTVDRTQQIWSYRAENEGALTLSLTCGTTIVLLEMTAQPTSIDVSAETNDLSLYLTSYGRSNNEDTPSVWAYGDINAELTGFNFTSDGWVLDDDGVTVLRVQGDARVTIPVQMFATDFRTSGKTIEIEFATRNVLNYDAVVISCFSGERGIKITAQKALLKSEQSEISTQYKEDEKVRLSFVVEKKAEHRLLCIYINGIMSGVVQYPADDDFSQNNPVGISIGSSECTTDIYGIRVYENNLTRYQILDNWNADMQVLSDRADTYKHNDIFDEYGAIVIEKLPADLPYMVLEGTKLPTYKGNKLIVSGRYVDPVDATKSFTFKNAEIDVQGTSSAGYERKNYKLKLKYGLTQNGTQRETYLLGENNIPTDTFTFKADVASSEGANNVELVKLYNDISPYRIPPQETDARVRQGIDGYPCVIFHDAGDGAVFIGKYNFNHDKGTPEIFGFDADDESWEIKNNTSNRVLFKDADYSGTAWQNDFEARHPDKNTNIANLKALAEWLVSTDRDAVDTEEEKAARLQKFKDEIENYLSLESTLFYYLFTELFLLADSRAKNAFPTRYDNGKWCWLPYDMDTAIGTNNEGKLAFDYYLEDTDLVNGAQVYNGQESVLWNNVRDAFPDELMEMYQKLRSDGVLSYEDTERRFSEHQAKWPVAIFNEDSYYKYLAPLFEKNNGSYLGMLQGSKAEQRKWWLYNRFRYIDSKYNAGDALTDFITLRGYAKGNVVVTPYADIYATVKYGSYLVQERALRGGSYTLECPVDDLDDTEIYIYSASQIANLGDLSALQVGYAEFAAGTKLTSLKLGDASSTYSNQNLTQLYAGNNVLLKTLDVRNCPNLGNTVADVNATPAIDLSGCVNIEEVYFDSTAITSVTLPNGGILKKLHLPSTVTNLTIRNQKQITEFVMPSYANISTLRLENVSNAVDGWTILQAIPADSRVRMIGFDWTQNSAEDILALYDYLDTMRGLDENGNNVDKAQMQGVIHIDSLTGSQLAEMQRRYPDIKVIYQHITSSVYFWNHDGTELLYTATSVDGAAVTYGGSVTPTKPSTAQYTFVFEGKWSLAPNGIADANALKNITADRNVYAAFTATVRTYTVTWSDGVSELEKDTNVPYGAIPTYNGSTPIDPDDYGEFTEWYPEISAVVGDITYTAQFVRAPMGSVWKQSNVTTGATRIVSGEGEVLAVNASKGVYASDNGRMWTQTSSKLFTQVCYGNRLYVAGNSQGLWYSTDKITWTKSNCTQQVTGTIFYGGGLWQASAYDGVYYSEDGRSWTKSNLTLRYANRFAYGNGIWVVAVQSNPSVYYSTDGKTWTRASYLGGLNSSAEDVIHDGEKFIAVGTYGAAYCTDGTTWYNASAKGMYSVIKANGMYVAGGASNGLHYSEDGRAWTQSNITTGTFTAAPCYGNGIWVAKNNKDNVAYYSTDGRQWQETTMSMSVNCKELIFIDNTFVMATVTLSGQTAGLWYSK